MKIRRSIPYLFCVLSLVAAGFAAGPETELPWSAEWIWKSQADYNPYNQTILARKRFKLGHAESGMLRITADSYYRLQINGQWVNDGPCRSWPEHFQYDVIDVSPYLVEGQNEMLITARYYGVGDFHRVPRHAGLLAQLDVKLANGKTATVITDKSWEVAEAKAWLRGTPKSCAQMEALEWYDARLEDQPPFEKAVELFAADQGPWKDLHARDSALLSRRPVSFKAFGGARLVQCEGWDYCLPAARLMNPGVIEANLNASLACGMATLLNTESGCTLDLQADAFKVAIDGKEVSGKERVDLSPGQHLVLAFVRVPTGHQKDISFRFMNPRGFTLVNPLDKELKNPWCFLPFQEFNFVTDDLVRKQFTRTDNPFVAERVAGYTKLAGRLLSDVTGLEDFRRMLGPRAVQLSAGDMFVQDPTWQFQQRTVTGDAGALVEHPEAVLYTTPEWTVIHPSPDGDIELMYDFGEQDIGYYTLDLNAPAGVVVDIFGIEYITPDGRLQHTGDKCRNGMRYITREGTNRFVSLKRRSGRYVFLTLRHQTGPVHLRNFSLIESTYPVNPIGSFSCSDTRLDRIWDISARTLKLCMEDTFTDCPLYEQTHWVGDARNESLMAYPVFDARDLGRRCIRLTAQSLERYPIVGCQTPSCWDVLLPAWSFLWGISAWDYYWYSGDTEFLRESYPAVIQNLKGAEKYVNDRGLFSGPFWNMFDWTGADQNVKTVVHNSMFMVGAIDAALKSAEVLHDDSQTAWLKSLRQRLVAGVNQLWDPRKQAYPDSVHEDGTISASTCQHTSFLSILYDIVEPSNLAAAKANLLNPPDAMVRLGSPFAGLYLLETYEKLGMEDRIVEEIYRDYLPMLEAGSTTVWESYATGTTGRDGFPTRSHCHAWSSAPSYFLNRVVLGIKPTAPAARMVTISPWISGLTWAKGTVATPKGPITVSWKTPDDKNLEIICAAPGDVEIQFVRNSSHGSRSVSFNGRKME